MDTTQKSPSVLSLCTGIRGLDRGIEAAIGPVRTIAFLEIEAWAVWNLVNQMEKGILDPAPIWTNLKTFPAGHFYNRIHGITGGFPCQPFSTAGMRGGSDDPRHLWPFIGKGEKSIVGTTRPLWCFFENVPGLLTLGYEEVKQDLRNLGYAVEEGIFSAEEVGAPHQRKRLFILAIDSKQLGHAQKSDKRWNWATESNQNRQTGRSNTSELEHASEQGQQECRSGIFSELQKEEGIGLHDRPEQSGPSELADTSIVGSETGLSRQEQGQEGQSRIVEYNSDKRKWPARPGEEQYQWEAPRTSGHINRLPNSIRTMWSQSRKSFAKMLGKEVFEETEFRIKAHFEPKFCSAVNGYNHREDLLRALGNGVVEDTSELAFRTLLAKHGLTVEQFLQMHS